MTNALRPAPLIDLAHMNCDGRSAVIFACGGLVKYGVRIYTPSMTQNAPGHKHVGVWTDLHCCAEHQTFTLEKLLTEDVRAATEDFARKCRPIDWKPNFAASFLQYVEVYSPEYRTFLASRGRLNHYERQQAWGGAIARV